MYFSTVCYLLFGFTLNVALSARLDLLQFFRSFDSNELKLLIDSGKYDINHQNPQGNTAIHDLVKSCVELQITPFAKNTSAIIDLIYTHCPSINVNLENAEGQTFLDIAAAPTIDDSRRTAYRNTKTRILLSTILKKEFENVNRAFYNSPEELRVLFVKQKSFKGDLPINGEYPLTTAMKSLSVELVEELLDLPEVNVNIKNNDGNTPILSMMTADHFGKYGILYNMKYIINICALNLYNMKYIINICALKKPEVDFDHKNNQGESLLSLILRDNRSLLVTLLETKKLKDVGPLVEEAIRESKHELLSNLVRDYAVDFGTIDIDGMNALQYLLQDDVMNKAKALTIKVIISSSAQLSLENVRGPLSYYEVIFHHFLDSKHLRHLLGSEAHPIRFNISWAQFALVVAESIVTRRVGWFVEMLRWLQGELADELEISSVTPQDPELVVFQKFLVRLVELLGSLERQLDDFPKLQRCIQIFESLNAKSKIESLELQLTNPLRFLIDFGPKISRNFASLLLKSNPPVFFNNKNNVEENDPSRVRDLWLATMLSNHQKERQAHQAEEDARYQRHLENQESERKAEAERQAQFQAKREQEQIANDTWLNDFLAKHEAEVAEHEAEIARLNARV